MEQIVKWSIIEYYNGAWHASKLACSGTAERHQIAVVRMRDARYFGDSGDSFSLSGRRTCHQPTDQPTHFPASLTARCDELLILRFPHCPHCVKPCASMFTPSGAAARHFPESSSTYGRSLRAHRKDSRGAREMAVTGTTTR